MIIAIVFDEFKPTRWIFTGLLLSSTMLFAQHMRNKNERQPNNRIDFASMNDFTPRKRMEWELNQSRSVVEAERGAIQPGEAGRSSFAKAALQLKPLVSVASFKAKSSTHELEGQILRNKGQWVVVTIQYELDTKGKRTGRTALFLNRKQLLGMPRVKSHQLSNIESNTVVEDKEIITSLGDHVAELRETQYWSRRRTMAFPSAPIGEYAIKPALGDAFVMNLVFAAGPQLEGVSFNQLVRLGLVGEDLPTPEYFGFTLAERPNEPRSYLELFDRRTGDLFKSFMGGIRQPRNLRDFPLISIDRQITAIYYDERVKRLESLYPHGKNSTGEYTNSWLLLYMYSLQDGLEIGIIHASGIIARIRGSEVVWSLPKPKNKLSYQSYIGFEEIVHKDARFIFLEAEKKKIGADRNKINKFDDQHMFEYDQIFKDARALEQEFNTPLNPELIKINETIELLGDTNIESELPAILDFIEQSTGGGVRASNVKIQYTEFPQLLKGIVP